MEAGGDPKDEFMLAEAYQERIDQAEQASFC